MNNETLRLCHPPFYSLTLYSLLSNEAGRGVVEINSENKKAITHDN